MPQPSLATGQQAVLLHQMHWLDVVSAEQMGQQGGMAGVAPERGSGQKKGEGVGLERLWRGLC